MRCVNNYSVLNYDDSMITCDNGMGTSTWTPYDVTEGHSQLLTSNETLECSCTDKQTRVLLAECVNGAGGEPTPRALTETSDWMYNMTGRNLSDWLVKTVDRFLQKRYGGLSMGEAYHSVVSADQLQTLFQLFEANSNFTLTNSANITSNAVDFTESLARTENAKVWFDNNGYHAMPTWLNILNNAALRSLLPPDKNPLDYGIAAVNHPLNFTKSTVDLAALSQNIKDTLISISVIFALSFIPASFVLFLIEEKVTKSKHLQFVSGVNQLIYWIANFMWDMINYTIPIIIVLFIFLAFQTKAYVSADNFPCLLCLLLLYGFAITPMMYPASFYFEVPSTAYVVLTCVNLFIGINASIATFIMEVLDDDNLKYINENYLKPAFLVFPQYCLGRGLLDMSINQAYADAYAAFGIDNFTPPFSFDLVGRNLMALAIEGTFFFILTILIQYRFFIPPQSSVHDINSLTLSASSSQDDDVLEERSRILNGDACDILQIKDLTKVYSKPGSGKDLVAVNRLCVGVPEGECFGLLGVNGAGKTTTFKMLTGDVIPTAGDSLICGQSILEDMREVQQNTGYCPQFEALCSLLTGREHLIFYAKLRGVPPEEVDGVADWAINKFGLKMYSDKPAGTYSGGNKRKLSAAIAFIGCPPIVFLDEPTAGMDPMARRFLWGRIAEAVKGGRCIVLTSHSMEECEALCTRLAIMVNGQLQCLGSPQHLKNRYGEGYMLTVKVGGMNPDLSKVETFVKSISNAVLKESHCNTIMFQVPLQRIRLSELFRLMEENKEELHIEDYSISQTTLDEVFVSFAKNQTDGLEDEYGIQPPSYVSTNNVDYDVPYNEEIGDVENGQLSDADGIIMQNFKSTYAPTASTDQLLV
ncbi:unnamed protein product [Clavelina lepadiformis]|uniref:ABC transporter domain-containing protein n=1 Tax=Clavelina lepadiformis TaxID=159417 RepID=A0ABP0FNN3_CLALP